MTSIRRPFPLVLLAVCSATLLAQTQGDSPSEEKPAIPPAPTHYMGRQIATTMHFSGAPWLVRDARQREEDTRTLLRVLDEHIEPGQTACDLGCGNGFYTLPLARMVGDKGVVYAVDIQQQMIQMLERRLERQEIRNVRPIVNTAVTVGVPEGSCDLILLTDVYHEFSHPEQMLKAIRNALKPSGRVALVEFRAEDDRVPIKPLHKMSKAQIRREWEANGFKIVEQFDGLPWQHLLFLQRDDAPQDPSPKP